MEKSISFYVPTTVIEFKSEERTYIKKLGWFKTEISKEIKHFMICEIEFNNCDRSLFKIPLSEKESNRLRIGDKVSIHIKAEYEYHCSHFTVDDKPEQKPVKTLEVEKGKS